MLVPKVNPLGSEIHTGTTIATELRIIVKSKSLLSVCLLVYRFKSKQKRSINENDETWNLESESQDVLTESP